MLHLNLVIYEYDFPVFFQHLREYSTCPLVLPSAEEQVHSSTIQFLTKGVCLEPPIDYWFTIAPAG